MLANVFGPLYIDAGAASSLHRNSSVRVHHRKASRRHSLMLMAAESGHYFDFDRTKPYWGHLEDSSWLSVKERYVDDLYDRVEQAKSGMNRYRDDPSKAFQSAIYTKVKVCVLCIYLTDYTEGLQGWSK